MTRRRARAATGLALICAAVGLTQCDRDRAEPPVADAPAPTPSAPQTALSRVDIVAALAQAGSSHAGGGSAGAGPMIAGRSFEVKLPFGCAGPDASTGVGAGLARWAWSQDRASISLTLTPADLTRSPLVVRAGETPTWDRVDGYWIARPWLAGDACPRSAPPAPVAAAGAPSPSTPGGSPVIEILTLRLPPSPQTAGLAVIQGVEASRLGRRQGEAYSFTVRGSGDQPVQPPADGYRLVLSGRIGSFPDGQAIRCASDSPDRRPVCLAAVELDSVAFEDSAGNRLSEWRPT